MSNRPFSRHLRVALPCAALLAFGTACTGNYPADVSGVVWVNSAPPRPIHEVRPYRPGPEFIWIEGYHRWTGAQYEWVPGRWEQRPRPHAKWNRGRWNHGDRGWYWVDGRWQGGDDDDHDHGHGRGHDRH